jgi:O-antigen/teichoic acid export membrane protein
VQDRAGDILPYNTAKGTIYLVAQNIIVASSSTFFFMFIARFLPSISDLGVINGLQIIIAMAVILAGLGLANSATRFMSYHFGGQRGDLAKGIGILIFRIGLVSSVVISYAMYMSANYIAIMLFHNADYTHLIQLGSIDTFLASMMSFSIGILFSLEEFRKIAIISIINSLLKSSSGFVLLFVFGMGVDGIVIGYIIADAVSLAIFVCILKPQILRGSPLSREMRCLVKFSLPLFGSAILSFLSVSIDYYLVLSLSGLIAAGIYSPAVLLVAVIITILVAVEQALLPYFSRIYGKSGLESLRNSSQFVSRYIFIICFPFGFAILASTPLIIVGILGERYLESIYPSIILTFTITLVSIGIMFNDVLKSAGHSRILLLATSAALSVQVIISVTTIPYIGALGAALARCSAYAIIFILTAIRLKQIAALGYDRDALHIGLVGSAIMASIIFTINYYLSNPFYLLVSLSIGFISYLIFLRFTRAMNTKDFEIINSIMLGKLKWSTRLLEKIVLR